MRSSLPVEIEHWFTASDIVVAAMHLSDLKNISGISIQYPLFARTTRQVNAGVCMEHMAGTFRIPAIILPQRQRES